MRINRVLRSGEIQSELSCMGHANLESMPSDITVKIEKAAHIRPRTLAVKRMELGGLVVDSSRQVDRIGRSDVL